MNIGIVGLFFFLALLGWYLSFTAARLDRLHHRVETSWANLDAALQRRVGVALEISNSGYLDPASSLLLAGAAHDAREAARPGNIGMELEIAHQLRPRVGVVHGSGHRRQRRRLSQACTALG